MSNIKIIKDLKVKEFEDICDNSEGCAKCPFLISSYNKKIHCLKDDKVEIYEVEKFYNLLNSKIDLETNKLVKDWLMNKEDIEIYINSKELTQKEQIELDYAQEILNIIGDEK